MNTLNHITANNISNSAKLLTNNYQEGIKLSHELIYQFNSCNAFYLSVAFINKSGLAVLKQTLIDLKNKGIKGKIITSSYLNFNHPDMFNELLKFDNIEVRIFDKPNIGFHPKGYIFKNIDSYNIIIGSTNLTQSALSTNQEWNILVSGNKNNELIFKVLEEFKLQWNHSIPLTTDWIKKYETIYTSIPTLKEKKNLNIEPNLMQQEALNSLNVLRNEK